jgi:hypothetical protein
MNPYYAFVCDKAVYGSSMWHVLWGVPSRMTVKGESMFLRESLARWIAAAVMTKHHLLAMTLAERTHSYHKESLVKWIAASFHSSQ